MPLLDISHVLKEDAYRYHGLMWALSYNLPSRLSDAFLFEHGRHLRHRYYKKLERQAKKA